MGDVSGLSWQVAIVVAFFGFLGLCVQSYWNFKTQKMLRSTHREVSVNGGKNVPATLNDKVGIVMTLATKLVVDLAAVNDKQDQLFAEQARLSAGQELAGTRQDEANARMDAHLSQSARMDDRLVGLEAEVLADRRSNRQ